MAMVHVASYMDNALLIWLDVDAQDRVVGIRVQNNMPTTTAYVEITRPSGQTFGQSFAPGVDQTIVLPNNRRFRYSDDVLSDYAVSVSFNG